MPPWTRGWSVFTRPPRISGAAVYSPTGMTRSPASASAFWVPPVERSSTPFAARRRAKGTSPVLSETESSARRTAKGHLRWGGASLLASVAGEFKRAGGPPALAVRAVPQAGPGLVLGHGPELQQTPGLDLADALPGEVHDGPHLLERDAAAVGDVERAGLRHLPDLLVREVELDGAGGRVHVQVEVVLAGDEHARARTGRAVGPVAGALRLHLADDLLDLGIDDAERPLAAQLPGDLLAGHRARPPPPAPLVALRRRVDRSSVRLRLHGLVAVVHRIRSLAPPRLVHHAASL